MADVFSTRKTYKFRTLAGSILGDLHDNMTVVSILPASRARTIKDIYTIHNNVKALVPGIPASTADCTFVEFVKPDKTTDVFAIEWLDLNSVEVIAIDSYRFTITNITATDPSIIRVKLLELGYTVEDIERV